MKLLVLFLVIIALGLTSASCVPGKDDRCGDDYVLNVDHCDPKTTESLTPLPPADSGVGDSGSEMPSGMGEICTDQAECEAFEASFCAMDPTAAEGICTIGDCAVGANDNCPSGWKCCRLPEFIPYPPFCIVLEGWEATNSSYGCGG